MGRLGLDGALAIVPNNVLPPLEPPLSPQSFVCASSAHPISRLPVCFQLSLDSERGVYILGYVNGTGGLGPSPSAWRIDGTVKTARGPQDPMIME